MSNDPPFWREKKLADMSQSEWESLCDGCGRCCLEKLEDLDTGEISYTSVACWLLDRDTCQCSNYSERQRLVPDCIELSPKNISELRWMPSSCAYRRLSEGKDLPDWHPLVTGDPGSTIAAGISVKGRAVDAQEVEDFEKFIVTWPQ